MVDEFDTAILSDEETNEMLDTPTPVAFERPVIPEQVDELPEEEAPAEYRPNPFSAILGSVFRGAASPASSNEGGDRGAGHQIQEIMTPDGIAQVETAPEMAAADDDELADLFEVPEEEDNDMFVDDLVAPPDDETATLDEEDMSDLFSMDEPLKAPKGRRIVRVVSRPSKRRGDLPTTMGGIR